MPKDFTGAEKNADTYDKDWVFVKTKAKGPNQSHGAWMTKRDARLLHEQQRRDRGARKRRREAALGGGSGGGGVVVDIPMGNGGTTIPLPSNPAGPWNEGTGTPANTTPRTPERDANGNVIPLPTNPGGPLSETASSSTTPATRTDERTATTSTTPPLPDIGQVQSWWISQAYRNPKTEEQRFANIANALLPTLSPEDQRNLANYLSQSNSDVYGAYANKTFDAIPTEITDQIRNQYLSPQRAQQAMALLDRMKQAAGATDEQMGAGYSYLKNAINLINQFTTDGVMTRERYQQFSNAIADLNKNASSQNLGAYVSLGQMFNLPQFSAGSLVSNAANSKLFA